jgi:hypothetical protein
MEPRTASSIEAGRRNIDAYYADILDIPVMRDDPGANFLGTREQILRLQNPTGVVRDDPNVYMDPFFNNSPYVSDYTDSGARKRDSQGLLTATDTRLGAQAVPRVSILDLWAGEMRALSNKEMTEGLSPSEEELLRTYQEYFAERTGMEEGGVVLPQYEQSGIVGLFADKLGLSEAPPFPVPINARQQSAIRQSGRQDFGARDEFYEPGAAGFADRLVLEYGYPGEFDPAASQEVFDMGGEHRHSRPADRRDLPTPQELEDVRAHMLGTALAAKGYGETGARFMGAVNEGIFGFHQGRRDKEMDHRNNAVGLDLFRQAGIDATPQQLTQMVDDAIFAQLDRIMARSPEARNFRSPESGPDLYFPRDERGNFATQY